MYNFQNSFTVGEITPRLFARSNLDQYKNALAKCENFYPWPYGGVERRSGTRFIKEVKNSNKKVRLIPFEFGTTQSYVLEFGDFYMRVYMNYGQVISGGVAYEITTPYSENDIQNIKFNQSFDKMWLVDGKHPVQLLTRFGHANWTLTASSLIGPFKDENVTSTTLTASAAGGSVTITASSALFTSADVGRTVAIKGDVTAWGGSTAYATGAIVFTTVSSTKRVYRCVNAGTSGSTAPDEEGDNITDGSVIWQYVDDGSRSWGYATITAFGSSTSVTATTTTNFPTTSATKAWRLGEFYSTVQPRAIAYMSGRMWLGGTTDRPQTLWVSKSNSWEDYSQSSYGLDTDSITDTLDVGKTNAVYWMEVMKDAMVVGTSDAMWRIVPNDSTKSISPSTVKAERIHTTGSSDFQGRQIGSVILYSGANKRIIHELAYVWSNDAFESQQMTLLAEHITGKQGVKEMAYQNRPFQMVWYAGNDGKLLSFTYLREQKVTGWATHSLGGGGIVESVCSLPASDYSQDDVYLVVRRTINGVTKRYIEYLEKSSLDASTTADWFFVDAGLTYTGAPATTISGLDHLEGATVTVFADGSVHPDRVVSSGAITLQTPASKVQVGFGFTSTLQTLRVDLTPQQSMMGKSKAIHRVQLDFYQSVGGKVGPSLDKLDEMFSVPYYAGPLPEDGFKEVFYSGGWEKDGKVFVVQDKPLPLNIRGIQVQFTGSDR